MQLESLDLRLWSSCLLFSGLPNILFPWVLQNLQITMASVKKMGTAHGDWESGTYSEKLDKLLLIVAVKWVNLISKSLL